MPLNTISKVSLFGIYGINFMGTFSMSYKNYYILVAIDYISKWMETITTSTNDAKFIVRFLKKHIFTHFVYHKH